MLKKSYLWIALVSLLTFILYSYQFSPNFIETLDDGWCIVQNPLVQNLSAENLKKIWFNETLDSYYLPLAYTSAAIEVALFGNNALAMKIINLLIFIASAWLLFGLLRLLWVSEFVAFTTMLIYLLHPIQIENIALAASVRQVVNVFFFLASAISYMKFFVPNQKNRIGYYLLALLFFILAMASKPTAIVFLPIAAFSIWM